MLYSINYLLTTDNGEVVDEAKDFSFEDGDGKLAPELEHCITQSSRDDLQTVLLSGSDVFGNYDESAVITMDKKDMPKDLQQHNAIDFKLPNGDTTIGVIKKIMQTEVLVDFNHPLSKCNLAFQFEILSKN